MRTDYAREVKNAFSDPLKVVQAFGLQAKAKRQARGFVVCCPVHGEKEPSMSIRTAKDGTISVICFACQFAGDVLSLTSAVYGLKDFRESLVVAANLAGHYSLADEIRGEAPQVERKPVPRPEPVEETDYPELSEVAQLWKSAIEVDRDSFAVRELQTRRIDFSLVARLDLARVISGQFLPRWAAHNRVSWVASGHTLAVRQFDASGAPRSVRVWRTHGDPSTPKRLPPAGRKASGLVCANRAGVAMLSGRVCPLTVIVCEGEPDWLTVATHRTTCDDVVLGIGSGSWSPEIAARVPTRSRVIIATHNDPAGHKYAVKIRETLARHRDVSRWHIGGKRDEE